MTVFQLGIYDCAPIAAGTPPFCPEGRGAYAPNGPFSPGFLLRKTAGEKATMNKRDLQKFKKLLLSERERFAGGMENLTKDNLYQTASDHIGIDPNNSAEVGTDHFDRETALKLAGSEAQMLYEIDEALKRIDEGTYGICEGSGKPIPKRRLEVFPTARYTVEYQSQLEKENRY